MYLFSKKGVPVVVVLMAALIDVPPKQARKKDTSFRKGDGVSELTVSQSNKIVIHSFISSAYGNALVD